MPEEKPKPGATGKGVDAQGGPVVDPTANVIALNDAAQKRQDDLRQETNTRMLAEVSHLKEMAALRAQHSRQLAEAEAKRIDAIRAVDVNAVAVASERAGAAATVLATQVAQSADALRTLVASTATAMAEQQRQLSTQFDSRLTLVERSQYEGKGKSAFSDPMMDEINRKMQMLMEGRGQTLGAADQTKTSSNQIMWAIGIMVMIALGIAALVVPIMRHG
jgi:hypothetical protein